MKPPVPFLADYGLSEENGFLPDEPPLQILPDPYYSRWEAVVANLQALLLSRRLREVVETLPILSTARLQHPEEWRRAYVLLAFMTHAYIWGDDRPAEARRLVFPQE
jgi:indoleamine 2,3-dioxygenase